MGRHGILDSLKKLSTPATLSLKDLARLALFLFILVQCVPFLFVNASMVIVLLLMFFSGDIALAQPFNWIGITKFAIILLAHLFLIAYFIPTRFQLKRRTAIVSSCTLMLAALHFFFSDLSKDWHLQFFTIYGAALATNILLFSATITRPIHDYIFIGDE